MDEKSPYKDSKSENSELKQKEHENLTSKNFIFVEGGTFLMGSNEGFDDEKPVHEVQVTDFYICKYQVTQAEWIKIMRKNPAIHKEKRNPVENISWFKAIEFCNKKSNWDGLTPCYEINKNEAGFK